MDPSSPSGHRRRRALVAAAAAVTLVLAAGCGAREPRRAERAGLPDGRSSQTIAVGGANRTFHVYRPAGLTGPAPLVVMLHGGFGSGRQAERSYGWNARADAGRFVVAYPDGLRRAWSVGGGCCGKPGEQGVDDVAFITAMVGFLQRETAIDPKRIYATGISNGGFMSYRLACETTLFAAIGPDAATQLGDCPEPKPISVIHIHGKADTSVRYDGRRGNGPARVDGPAVPEVNKTWRDIGECGKPKVTASGPVTTSTAACPDRRAVTLVTIDGAGHQWPGSTQTRIQRLVGSDPPSAALDATRTIWRFFSAHPKP